MVQKVMINRKMKKDIENPGRNAKKKKKRKNRKGEDGISIRLGNASQNIGGAYFNSRFRQGSRELEKKSEMVLLLFRWSSDSECTF